MLVSLLLTLILPLALASQAGAQEKAKKGSSPKSVRAVEAL
jgi:hypothetical protein